MDVQIGMGLCILGFAYVRYGGDLKVSVNGKVWNNPESLKDVGENFGMEPVDSS